jgi:hypothetical protein
VVSGTAAPPSREERRERISGTDPLRGWDLEFPAIVNGPLVRQ